MRYTTSGDRRVGRRSVIAQAIRVMGTALLMAGVVMPVALEAQGQGRGGDGMRPGMRGGSVAFLLEKSEDLSLSDAQKEQFEVLVAELRETNQPLAARMREARGGDRSAMRELRTELRTNDQAVLEKAMALLDEGQQKSAKELLDSRRPQRRGPPG